MAAMTRKSALEDKATTCDTLAGRKIFTFERSVRITLLRKLTNIDVTDATNWCNNLLEIRISEGIQRDSGAEITDTLWPYVGPEDMKDGEPDRAKFDMEIPKLGFLPRSVDSKISLADSLMVNTFLCVVIAKGSAGVEVITDCWVAVDSQIGSFAVPHW